ncbi:hypothetical protein BBJ29_001639 [Phytophthora kernoviae]|uniref:Uncharacterized protein n=1 Tax=Phytophthora kernoviae TaxID=325452 RepID=A0A3F2RI51_9STRA|nr:hypothetical protein BBJ29_001639 [Phytophthora kernoviae]RLN57564.1 hypothetical protein BBP00_00007458 [Phytophthora kernoviae]
MDYVDRARRAPWIVVYVAAGFYVLVNLLGEAYGNAVAVCDLYPQFSFRETLWEELTMHHTHLPVVRIHVPTLQLLGAYAAVYLARRWGFLDRGWPLLIGLLSGRWLYHQLFERLPSYLPFVFSEPGVPELLSEDENGELDDDAYFEDVPKPPVDDDACNEALAKLVQVKMKHANHTISRPDDWLVFDPVQEKLILQKHAKNGGKNGVLNGKKVEVDGKLSLHREQEPIGDNTQQELLSAGTTPAVGKKVETWNQPQNGAAGVRQ